jgi:hypothetical protein
MNEQKGLATQIGETIDRYLAERKTNVPEVTEKHRHRLDCLGRQMIPNIGTVLVVVILLLTVPSLAAPLQAPSATSTSTISYQGRLADSAGNPLTDKYNMEFRIYDVPTGGTPLWTEMWTGANAVDVSDGLFNVMLGSIDGTLALSIENHDELYLGITVGTDSEMVPRVQLGSVPFSMQALSLPDGAITTTMLANGTVTQDKLAASALPVFSTSTTTTDWVVPSCGGSWLSDPSYHPVSGLSLTIVVERSSTLLVDFTGAGWNNTAGRAFMSAVFVDGASVRTAGGSPLVGGCRNDPGDTGEDSLCTVANSVTKTLDPGSHTVDVRIWCDSGTVTITNGWLRGVLVP